MVVMPNPMSDAQAEPATPSSGNGPQPKIRNGLRIAFSTVEASMMYMAGFGSLMPRNAVKTVHTGKLKTKPRNITRP